MPYITPERRLDIGDLDMPAETAGELNYQLTQLVMWYVRSQPKGYQTFNDALGALEGAKQEFYRRVVVPYEEQKRFENGDVYEL